MKKGIVLLVFCLMSIGIVNAQTSTFQKGNGVLNLTIGFGSGLYTGGGYTTSVPPLAASYEVGIVDNIFEKGTIGVGGYFGFASAKYNVGYSDWAWKYTNIVIGPRGTLHYPLVEKLDTYAGLMIGYNIVNASWTGSGSSNLYSASGSGLITAGFLGARYYFSDKFAGLAELGWGVAYFNLGVAFKLK
ncbi:MAG: hypothetical protein Q8928_11045 [Bacteroidota bacterium]|nr:hypothetical protein [Bacteroidota bacterium]